MSPQDRELMQQALDALQNSGKDCGKTGKRAAEFLCRKVCDALRARLAEPETPAPTLFRANLLRLCPTLTHEQIDELAAMARPAARKVQPLTDEQIDKAAEEIDNESAFVAGFYKGARYAEGALGITGNSHE